jgi:hypothetical protein
VKVRRKMSVRRGASCACYVGVFYCLYFINIGNTQLLINVKNQVNYYCIISTCNVCSVLLDDLRSAFAVQNCKHPKNTGVNVAPN